MFIISVKVNMNLKYKSYTQCILCFFFIKLSLSTHKESPLQKKVILVLHGTTM